MVLLWKLLKMWSCATVTDVMRSPFFPSSFIRFVVRWLGSSFAFLFGFVRLEKCKCATKCVEFLKQV